MITIICAHCEREIEKAAGVVNRSRKIGAPLYCGKMCSGLGRRQWKTEAQKVEEKRIYDDKYRAKNLDLIKVKKAAHFQATYDPVAAAIDRKKRMPKHLEYCRTPEYREYKQKYDQEYRAREYGDYAEAFMLVQDLNRTILERATRYEIDLQNGKLCKTTRRKREYARIVGRESQERAVGNAERHQVGHDASRAGRRNSRTGS